MVPGLLPYSSAVADWLRKFEERVPNAIPLQIDHTEPRLEVSSWFPANAGEAPTTAPSPLLIHYGAPQSSRTSDRARLQNRYQSVCLTNECGRLSGTATVRSRAVQLTCGRQLFLRDSLHYLSPPQNTLTLSPSLPYKASTENCITSAADF